jgi:hypothetical protein
MNGRRPVTGQIAVLTYRCIASPRQDGADRARGARAAHALRRRHTDHTLEEVGQQFSVTRERIRQIEAKALCKLKHPSRSRKLRSFLDT